MNNKKTTISVVIPCFNEAEGLRKILPQLREIADEIIVVNNGSGDDTAIVAKTFGAYVVSESRKGYGRAYQLGFQHTHGTIIVAMDGDGSYQTDFVQVLADKVIKNQADFVSGSRFPLSDRTVMGVQNQLANRFISRLCCRLFRISIQDLQSGMWAFKRTILNQIVSSHPGMAFSQEIKLNAILNPNIRFTEINISYNKRIGKTKFRTWNDARDNLIALLKYRLKKSKN